MKEIIENSDLEKQLESALSPINPQNDFISDLQERLKRNALIAIEKPDYLIGILMILSGLIFGVVGLFIIKMMRRILRRDSR